MKKSNHLVRSVATGVAACLLSTLGTSAYASVPTSTPIKHIVVIFQENVSFDHYFGTYPNALNPDGVPAFHAAPGTPTVNGLSENLLSHNPNSANPQRLSRAEALTCDQDHHYGDEQSAFDGGLMDKFVQYTDKEGCSAPEISKPNLVMDYYDGNTVTAMWNYAQNFAMSDNSFDTTFGPSTPGALNLVSGQTWGAISTQPATDTYGVVDADGNGVGTVINDPDPTYDDCSNIHGTSYPTVSMVDSNKNIGELLSAKGVTWGWFQGGFMPTSRTADGKAVCGAAHDNIGGVSYLDYIPHHEPFQYYASTANPHHLAPTSVAMIGRQDRANHQYDLKDFWSAVDAGNMPAVSFLKAAAYQDGHAGYSDPLDEQNFIVDAINRLEQTPDWKNTAVIIAYDDSDGWYDHQMSPIVNQSNSPSGNDRLVDGTCGTGTGLGGETDRCGHGPRQPLLVISPWAKKDFVDHSVTDLTSILRFIEDNWSTGHISDDSFDAKAGSLDNMFDFDHRLGHARQLFLNPVTGLVTGDGPDGRVD